MTVEEFNSIEIGDMIHLQQSNHRGWEYHVVDENELGVIMYCYNHILKKNETIPMSTTLVYKFIDNDKATLYKARK